jgi:hypothetical protein
MTEDPLLRDGRRTGMKSITIAAVVALAGVLVVIPFWSAKADEPKEGRQAELSDDAKGKAKIESTPDPPLLADAPVKASTSAVSVPIYRPPLRGAPVGRLGGGSRGGS